MSPRLRVLYFTSSFPSGGTVDGSVSGGDKSIDSVTGAGGEPTVLTWSFPVLPRGETWVAEVTVIALRPVWPGDGALTLDATATFDGIPNVTPSASAIHTDQFRPAPFDVIGYPQPGGYNGRNYSEVSSSSPSICRPITLVELTSTSDSLTAGTELAIHELVTLLVTVVVPELGTDNLVLSVAAGEGIIEEASLVSITVGESILNSTSGHINPGIADGGAMVNASFGGCENVATQTDDTGDQIVMAVSFRVADHPTNAAGSILTIVATFHYLETSGGSPATSSGTTSFTVVEPSTVVSVTSTPSFDVAVGVMASWSYSLSQSFGHNVTMTIELDSHLENVTAAVSTYAVSRYPPTVVTVVRGSNSTSIIIEFGAVDASEDLGPIVVTARPRSYTRPGTPVRPLVGINVLSSSEPGYGREKPIQNNGKAFTPVTYVAAGLPVGVIDNSSGADGAIVTYDNISSFRIISSDNSDTDGNILAPGETVAVELKLLVLGTAVLTLKFSGDDLATPIPGSFTITYAADVTPISSGPPAEFMSDENLDGIDETILLDCGVLSNPTFDNDMNSIVTVRKLAF